MQTLSRYLKNRREELGLSLEDCSFATKIRLNYLQIIESGNILEDTFPSGIYRQGFIKNYARFLGLNPEYAVALDRREVELCKQDTLLTTHSHIPQISTFNYKKLAWRIVISIIVILFVTLGYIQYIKLTEFPKLTLRQPEIIDISNSLGNDLVIDKIVTDGYVNIIGNIENGTTVKINSIPQNINTTGEFRIEKKRLEKGVNNTFVIEVSRNQFAPVAKITLNILWQ